MKLFYATGTCSLSPHIVAEEAGIPLELERIDISKTPRLLSDGDDYASINPNLYVPALQLDDGAVLTEGAAIALYLADQRPDARLAPPAGSFKRYQHYAWLVFVATELHKAYSPWLFHAEYPREAQDIARGKIILRLAHVEHHLETSGPFLLGENFTAADAYLFTIVGWSSYAKVDLKPFPKLREFVARVGGRPAVQRAMRGEGMKVAA